MLTLQSSSLDWAVKHALNYGDTDVFPRPFEFEAIQYDWSIVRQSLERQDVLQWAVRPHRSLLAPKGRHGFRVVTQLDPLDFLLFTATVIEIAQDLEARRILKDRNVVFSYRYLGAPDGQFFDPAVGYASFLATAEQKASRSNTTYVAIADIADFYPRIYHHRLENSLHSATSRTSHVRAIMHLLSGWNASETFGIPVGNAACRLLAEITISDVDEALLANSIEFIRYNDDYRIFTSNPTEAYRHLAFLAEVLYRNHGLSLQQQKTGVLESSTFIERYLETPAHREIESLRSRFEELLETLDLSNRYEPIEYDDLDEDQQRLVDSLNLVELFRDEVASDNADLLIVRFILRRLGQLGDDAIVDEALDNIDVLHPVLSDIVRYLHALSNLSAPRQTEIGRRMLDLLENSILSELPYHRMWVLDLFARSTDWNQGGRFTPLLASATDVFSTRKLILAMGRSGHRHWFQSQWRTLFDQPHWPRRALIAAASCMPADARRHWYRSIETRLDPLEKAVMRWARNAPFGP